MESRIVTSPAPAGAVTTQVTSTAAATRPLCQTGARPGEEPEGTPLSDRAVSSFPPALSQASDLSFAVLSADERRIRLRLGRLLGGSGFQSARAELYRRIDGFLANVRQQGHLCDKALFQDNCRCCGKVASTLMEYQELCGPASEHEKAIQQVLAGLGALHGKRGQALKRFEQAAARQHPEGLYWAGLMTVFSDLKKSHTYMLKAQELGIAQATRWVATILVLMGMRIISQRVGSHYSGALWLNTAELDQSAPVTLSAQERDLFARLAREAAMQGNLTLFTQMADFYMYGLLGFEKNQTRALLLLEQMVQMGSPAAMFRKALILGCFMESQPAVRARRGRPCEAAALLAAARDQLHRLSLQARFSIADQVTSGRESLVEPASELTLAMYRGVVSSTGCQLGSCVLGAFLDPGRFGNIVKLSIDKLFACGDPEYLFWQAVIQSGSCSADDLERARLTALLSRNQGWLPASALLAQLWERDADDVTADGRATQHYLNIESADAACHIMPQALFHLRRGTLARLMSVAHRALRLEEFAYPEDRFFMAATLGDREGLDSATIRHSYRSLLLRWRQSLASDATPDPGAPDESLALMVTEEARLLTMCRKGAPPQPLPEWAFGEARSCFRALDLVHNGFFQASDKQLSHLLYSLGRDLKEPECWLLRRDPGTPAVVSLLRERKGRLPADEAVLYCRCIAWLTRRHRDFLLWAHELSQLARHDEAVQVLETLRCQMQSARHFPSAIAATGAGTSPPLPVEPALQETDWMIPASCWHALPEQDRDDAAREQARAVYRFMMPGSDAHASADVPIRTIMLLLSASRQARESGQPAIIYPGSRSGTFAQIEKRVLDASLSFDSSVSLSHQVLHTLRPLVFCLFCYYDTPPTGREAADKAPPGDFPDIILYRFVHLLAQACHNLRRHSEAVDYVTFLADSDYGQADRLAGLYALYTHQFEMAMNLFSRDLAHTGSEGAKNWVREALTLSILGAHWPVQAKDIDESRLDRLTSLADQLAMMGDGTGYGELCNRAFSLVIGPGMELQGRLLHQWGIRMKNRALAMDDPVVILPFLAQMVLPDLCVLCAVDPLQIIHKLDSWSLPDGGASEIDLYPFLSTETHFSRIVEGPACHARVRYFNSAAIKGFQEYKLLEATFFHAGRVRFDKKTQERLRVDLTEQQRGMTRLLGTVVKRVPPQELLALLRRIRQTSAKQEVLACLLLAQLQVYGEYDYLVDESQLKIWLERACSAGFVCAWTCRAVLAIRAQQFDKMLHCLSQAGAPSTATSPDAVASFFLSLLLLNKRHLLAARNCLRQALSMDYPLAICFARWLREHRPEQFAELDLLDTDSHQALDPLSLDPVWLAHWPLMELLKALEVARKAHQSGKLLAVEPFERFAQSADPHVLFYLLAGIRTLPALAALFSLRDLLSRLDACLGKKDDFLLACHPEKTAVVEAVGKEDSQRQAFAGLLARLLIFSRPRPESTATATARTAAALTTSGKKKSTKRSGTREKRRHKQPATQEGAPGGGDAQPVPVATADRPPPLSAYPEPEPAGWPPPLTVPEEAAQKKKKSRKAARSRPGRTKEARAHPPARPLSPPPEPLQDSDSPPPEALSLEALAERLAVTPASSHTADTLRQEIEKRRSAGQLCDTDLLLIRHRITISYLQTGHLQPVLSWIREGGDTGTGIEESVAQRLLRTFGEALSLPDCKAVEGLGRELLAVPHLSLSDQWHCSALMALLVAVQHRIGLPRSSPLFPPLLARCLNWVCDFLMQTPGQGTPEDLVQLLSLSDPSATVVQTAARVLIHHSLTADSIDCLEALFAAFEQIPSSDPALRQAMLELCGLSCDLLPAITLAALEKLRPRHKKEEEKKWQELYLRCLGSQEEARKGEEQSAMDELQAIAEEIFARFSLSGKLSHPQRWHIRQLTRRLRVWVAMDNHQAIRLLERIQGMHEAARVRRWLAAAGTGFLSPTETPRQRLETVSPAARAWLSTDEIRRLPPGLPEEHTMTAPAARPDTASPCDSRLSPAPPVDVLRHTAAEARTPPDSHPVPVPVPAPAAVPLSTVPPSTVPPSTTPVRADTAPVTADPDMTLWCALTEALDQARIDFHSQLRRPPCTADPGQETPHPWPDHSHECADWLDIERVPDSLFIGMRYLGPGLFWQPFTGIEDISRLAPSQWRARVGALESALQQARQWGGCATACHQRLQQEHKTLTAWNSLSQLEKALGAWQLTGDNWLQDGLLHIKTSCHSHRMLKKEATALPLAASFWQRYDALGDSLALWQALAQAMTAGDPALRVRNACALAEHPTFTENPLYAGSALALILHALSQASLKLPLPDDVLATRCTVRLAFMQHLLMQPDPLHLQLFHSHKVLCQKDIASVSSLPVVLRLAVCRLEGLRRQKEHECPEQLELLSAQLSGLIQRLLNRTRGA